MNKKHIGTLSLFCMNLIFMTAYISASVSTEAQKLLYAALNARDLTLLNQALSEGANPLAFDEKKGQTPLHNFLEPVPESERNTAQIIGMVNAILDHLEHQQQQSQRINFKERLLRFLRYRSHVAEPESFSVDVEDVLGRTPLTVALIKGYRRISELLQERGHANINYQNSAGNTVLHCMIEYFPHALTGKDTITSYKKRLQFAFERGANINMQNAQGQTPLMIAVQKYNYPAIDAILNYIPPQKLPQDAHIPIRNAELRDNNNKTAYDYAHEMAQTFNAQYLELLKSACNVNPLNW